MTLPVVIRPARTTDRTQMLEITRDVWDGTDYFPYVWDHWVRSPVGILSVAEVNGRVVGLQRVDLQPDSTAWLEGIRVAEAARGQGIGQHLLGSGLAWARTQGCSRARLSTSNLNVASNRLAETAGMRRIASFIPSTRIETDNLPKSARVHVAPASRREEIRQFLTRNAGTDHQLYTDGWTAHSLTDSRLALLLAVAAVVTVGEDTIEAVGIATTRSGETLEIGLLLGSQKGICNIAAYVGAAASRSAVSDVRAMVESDAMSSLEQMGYVQNGEHVMHVYETMLS